MYFSITICDLNCRMNSLLAAFSYCNSDTTNTNTNTFILEIYTYIHEIFWKYIHDMAMKRKFMMYAPGNRNYGYCRLHFGYQIMIYIYIYI